MKKQQNNPSKKRRATNGHNSIIEVPHRKAGGIVKNSKRRQLSNSEQDYMRQLNEAVKRLHTQLMLNRRKRAGYTAMIGQVITPEIVIILRNAVKVFPDEVADKTSKEFSTFVRSEHMFSIASDGGTWLPVNMFEVGSRRIVGITDEVTDETWFTHVLPGRSPVIIELREKGNPQVLHTTILRKQDRIMRGDGAMLGGETLTAEEVQEWTNLNRESSRNYAQELIKDTMARA